MKKTITIPDRLVKPARVLAVKEGKSFKRFLEELLIDKLKKKLNK